MASVQTEAVAPQDKMQRFFIGRAWLNKSAKGEYFNIKFDNGTKLEEIDNTCVMQLWPNTKRPDKKDADFRLSILVPNKIEAQA